MRLLLIVCLFTIGSAPLPAQGRDAAGAAFPSVDLPPEIDRVLRDYERAWRARDPAALAQLFTSDGFVLPSGGPPVRGRASIEQRYANAGGALVLRALAFATADSVGYVIGTYGWEEQGADAGKFVLALRKDGAGRWLIAADIDNQNHR